MYCHSLVHFRNGPVAGTGPGGRSVPGVDVGDRALNT